MAGRTSGLGPTSATNGQTLGGAIRVGRLGSGSLEANALLVLVALEILVQILLRSGPFRGAHGG